MSKKKSAVDRWVSCSRDASWAASQERHIVRQGSITSACGASASMPDVWRGNRTKPKCQACLRAAADPDLVA